MNTRTLRQFKASLTMTERQQHLLDGMMLGDGHLERQRGALFARLKIEHSVAQSAYVDWKYEEWRDWVRTPPRDRVRRNRLGTTSMNRGFTTLSHHELETFRLRFYRDHRKVVPVDLTLTPVSVGVWFMDDGSKKSSQCRGVYFNTQSFAPPEIEILRLALRRDAGVETTVRQQSDGTQIYVPSSSVGALAAFIGPELLPCMRYKLPG